MNVRAAANKIEDRGGAGLLVSMENKKEDSSEVDAINLQKLDNQLCFPIYLASRLVTKNYQPLLEPYGITYPQYLVLLVLWEEAPCPVSRIGKRLILNTNTLTPLLKRLEHLGYVTRTRSQKDERVVQIDLTEKGEMLKSSCSCIPQDLAEGLPIAPKKALQLKVLLEELINGFSENEKTQ